MRPVTPLLTVDALILLPGRRLVLVRRRNLPAGWALPGGFVDPGESALEAVRREALEETGLEIEVEALLGAYTRPWRDPRGDTASLVYACRAEGEPEGGDDAAEAVAFSLDRLPLEELAFDHGLVVRDYLRYLETGESAPLDR